MTLLTLRLTQNGLRFQFDDFRFIEQRLNWSLFYSLNDATFYYIFNSDAQNFRRVMAFCFYSLYLEPFVDDRRISVGLATQFGLLVLDYRVGCRLAEDNRWILTNKQTNDTLSLFTFKPCLKCSTEKDQENDFPVWFKDTCRVRSRPQRWAQVHFQFSSILSKISRLIFIITK